MKEMCAVTNRSAGRTVYRIPEDGIRREFFPHETKKNIRVSELVKLIQRPGGLSLLYNHLYIDDPEIVRYLINGEEAPEYWITEDNLPNWMNTCELAVFQDALDFAPEGIKDLIKKYAVSLPLNDYDKRKAIKDQLGFDVTKAIENSGEEESAAPAVKPAGRRVAVNNEVAEQAAPARRVIAPAT